MIKGLLAAGAVLLAAGCGSSHAATPAKTVTAAPAPSAPPADGGAFDTPADIMAKAGSALPCSDAEPMTPIGAKAQSACAGKSVIVRVYNGHDGVDQQIDLLSDDGVWLLTGENWSVNAPKVTLEAARVKLGGKLVDTKCVKTIAGC